MKTYFVFPTRNRIEKAKKTLATVDCDEITPFIIADGCTISAAEFDCELTQKQVGSVMARNIALSKLKGNAIVGTDDISFVPGALKKTMDLFNKHFPDTDGVIGMRQSHEGHHPTGVALVGDAFLNRYPNRWLYCPYYYHFACQEIAWHAEKIKKFVYTDFVCLEHLHPGRHKEGIDRTHEEARVYKSRDKTIRSFRHKLGLIWGYNG